MADIDFMKLAIYCQNEYKENKLKVQPDDLLVFLNKANSYTYYIEHKNKMIFHRSKEQSYCGLNNQPNSKYVFGKNRDIPESFINDLKKEGIKLYILSKASVPNSASSFSFNCSP